MTDEELVKRLRERARKLDEDDFETFADEVSGDYLQAADRLEAMAGRLAKVEADPTDDRRARR